MSAQSSRRFDPGHIGPLPPGRKILDPHMRLFGSIPLTGFRTYQMAYRHVLEKHDKTAATNIVSVHMIDLLVKAVSGVPGLRLLNLGYKQSYVSVEEKVLVRLKKLSRSLHTSNIPTKIQRELFSGQLDFFSGNRFEHIVTVGYVPNKTWTDIEGVYMVERLNGQLVWFAKFGEDLEVMDTFGTMNLFDGPTNGNEEKPQLRIRKDRKRDDDNQNKPSDG